MVFFQKGAECRVERNIRIAFAFAGMKLREIDGIPVDGLDRKAVVDIIRKLRKAGGWRKKQISRCTNDEFAVIRTTN